MRLATPELVLLLVLPILALGGCSKEGCLSGDDAECIVPSPCNELAFSCDGGSVSIRIVQPGDAVPGGMASLAAPGDVLMSNDQVTLVIDALDHPHYLAPTGGGILDFTTTGDDNDSMRHTFQATGVLPDEAAAYTDMQVIEEDGLVAVQFRGTLDGRPDMPIATRYELRPCEPGVRIRTELVNREPDPSSVLLADGSYFGQRELLPFTPTLGRGFDQPSFGLSTLGDVVADSPYLVAAAHSEPAATYATVACSHREITGFQSEEVAANGVRTRVVMPRDYVVYERFLAAARGKAVSAAADLALELRRQLWGEEWTTLSGRLTTPSGAGGFGEALRAGVLVSEGRSTIARSERTPWTHALPDEEGRFSIRVPTGRDYVLEVEAYGRIAAEFDLSVGEDAVDAGDLEIPDAGRLQISAT
ncbi:MAG: hypothetical protein VX498_07940, partial [Myxococcota bacterium]|nr:hypothetical protein [Myxococcota bacterium]